MSKKLFGIMPSGEEVSLYTLENADTKVTFTDYGAAIVSFEVFGKDVIGGFDTIMVPFYRYITPLFRLIARNVSAR